MKPSSKYIQDVISTKEPGEILTPNDFRSLGTDAAIRNTLYRLVKEGKLKRIAHGIYYIPKTDPVLGELLPGADQLVTAIVEKEKIRIQPTGAYALNKLGLSTQIPTRMIYMTDGRPRQIKLGKMLIRFKQTTPKKMSMSGPFSSLLLKGLEDLNLKRMDRETEIKISEILKKESPELLKQDLKLASAAVHDYIVTLQKRNRL
jgi:hypothetical protein